MIVLWLVIGLLLALSLAGLLVFALWLEQFTRGVPEPRRVDARRHHGVFKS